MNVKFKLKALIITSVVTLSSLYLTFNLQDKKNTINNIKCDAYIKSKIINKHLSANITPNEESIFLNMHITLAFFKNNTGIIKIKGYLQKKGITYHIERYSNFSYDEIIDDNVINFYDISHHINTDDTYPEKSDPNTPFLGIIAVNNNFFVRHINKSSILFHNFYVPSFICNII